MKKPPFKEPEKTKPRKAEEPVNPFNSQRYLSRAGPVAAMRPYEFVETEADRTFKQFTSRNPEIERNALHAEYGDPSRYGLNANEAFPRFVRRFVNFEPSSVYSQYAFRGDPLFVQQMALGIKRRIARDIPPPHMLTLPTEGVAGALRLLSEGLLFPPGEDGHKDNVIAPMYTYLSHMAEVVRRDAEIRSCMLESDGQVDLHHMEDIIDANTRAVIIATVGNPLAIAIKHERYEDMLKLIDKKMKDLGHPIWLIADVIYEDFRRESNGPPIDPIQKSLSMGKQGIDVPTVEVFSFSKMFAMAGQRLGFLNALASPHAHIEHSSFRDERKDALTALEIVYDTSLCPVPSLLQKPIGKMYFSIKNRLLCEELFAPYAAVLSAMSEMTKLRGRVDSHTMLPEEVPEEIVRTLGLDPAVWFTTSAIAKNTRRLAQNDLSKYAVDMHTGKVEKIGKRLLEAGMIEERTIEVDRDAMSEVFLSAVSKHAKMEEKLLDGLKGAEDYLGKQFSAEVRKAIIRFQLASLAKVDMEKVSGLRKEIEDTQAGFGLRDAKGDVTQEKTIKLKFYRLKDDARIPELPRGADGQLELYGIAEKIFLKKVGGSEDWQKIGERCKIPNEDALHDYFLKSRIKKVYVRIDAFVNAMEDMRKRGLGVYLHPSYYDESGKLCPERINDFYVLFGFEKLRGSADQSSEFMSICVANNEDIVKTTPGNIFLAPDVREFESSYIRFIPLFDTEHKESVISKSDMGRAIRAIEIAAKALASSETQSPSSADENPDEPDF